MAITALNSAATGLRALSARIDVVANNLANAETNGFKRSRVNFEDLMYQTLKQPGVTNAESDVSPAGIFVGLGTKISNTQLDMSQGSPEKTDNSLDVCISGPGFFKVKLMPSINNGEGYTRNGNFFVNSNNELVMGAGDGYKVLPAVTFQKNTTSVQITEDGKVSASVAGGPMKQVGQLELAQFPNPQGLNLLGGGIYVPTDASGQAALANPIDNGNGKLLQGYLETSNVDPVKELVSLIKTQRSFEMNSQSIQAADQSLQTINNLRRG